MPQLKNVTNDDLRVVGLNPMGLTLIKAGESVVISDEQAADEAYHVPGVYEIVGSVPAEAAPEPPSEPDPEPDAA